MWLNKMGWDDFGVLFSIKSLNVNKSDIKGDYLIFFFLEMKIIVLYVVVGFSGIIFVIVDG